MRVERKGRRRIYKHSVDLLLIVLTVWTGIAALIGFLVPKLGVTYALLTSQAPQKSGVYNALSGQTAFTVTPVPVSLGTYTAGGPVNNTSVFTIFNKTSGYTRKTNVDDLQIDLVLDSVATVNVTISCTPLAGGTPVPCGAGHSYALKYGQTARVSIDGTAGPTAGPLTGYFRITGLNGFLVLDIPINGTLTSPPAGAGSAAPLDGILEPLPLDAAALNPPAGSNTVQAGSAAPVADVPPEPPNAVRASSGPEPAPLPETPPSTSDTSRSEAP